MQATTWQAGVGNRGTGSWGQGNWNSLQGIRPCNDPGVCPGSNGVGQVLSGAGNCKGQRPGRGMENPPSQTWGYKSGMQKVVPTTGHWAIKAITL